MKFYDTESQRASVLKYWELTGEEPFAHPDYLAAFGDQSSGVVVDDSNGTVTVVPIILRSLATVRADLSGMDCSSPYGYGGPYSQDGRIRDGFLSEFASWLRHEGHASAFLRLDPRAGALPLDSGSQGCVIEVSDNVIVNVALGSDELWRSYDSKVRKNVKRATASGCSVIQVDPLERLDDFLRIYHGTMLRRGASDFYMFERRALERLVSADAPLGSMFFVIDPSGSVISVELVLTSRTAVYSFLGGTSADHFALRPNDLLKHEISLWARASGRSQFVLGGGYARNDGIFKYKRSFSPTGVCPFYVARMVGDAGAYRAAMQAAGSRPEVDMGAEYFPEYRKVTGTD